MNNTVIIAGVKIHVISKKETLQQVNSFVQSKNQHYIVTTNPEFIVEAQNNSQFREVLNNASLSVSDGVGILWGSWLLRKHNNGQRVRERITGVELFLDICAEAEKNEWKVFLLGAGEGVAQQTQNSLLKKHPHLKVVGCYAGSPKIEDEDIILKKINLMKPDIVFVAYGAPAQELWIARNLSKMESVRLAVGIGGTFDFISGNIKRAPAMMRKLGLEWLWRLILQPSRIKRIYNATARFLWIVLRHSKNV